ncbi:hypothetical protein AD928_02415 [Acetobacter cerevisiae]|uniref:Uncharacterized protein n=1 Tax=Acetobacter cerevisiae TaxID=178900 RepID=A0A149QPT1_9PROT|nr:hypothetical protein AD928_02415 [Acetobacter cerevisiae]
MFRLFRAAFFGVADARHLPPDALPVRLQATPKLDPRQEYLCNEPRRIDSMRFVQQQQYRLQAAGPFARKECATQSLMKLGLEFRIEFREVLSDHEQFFRLQQRKSLGHFFERGWGEVHRIASAAQARRMCVHSRCSFVRS